MTLSPTHFFLIVALLGPQAAAGQESPSLLKKRGSHQTKLVKKLQAKEELAKPPKESFSLVQYPTKLGKMGAYLSRPDDLTKKHPAIIWITGGFPSGGGGPSLWESTDRSNEQSARIYRLNGVMMMFPSLRGGAAGNPGQQEQFYGEVDDVISAYNYLRKLKYVDPKRIYLGGHSTGGTLAILVAASTEGFAGVISLGPVAEDYGKDGVPFEWTEKERELRHPIKHLGSIKTPTYIIEGSTGNIDSLNRLKKANKNKHITVLSVEQADHYTVIHPVNTIMADAMVASTDGKLNVKESEIQGCYLVEAKRSRETTDIETVARYRSGGMDLTKPRLATFYILSRDEDTANAAMKDVAETDFKGVGPDPHKDSDGDPYYTIKANKRLDLTQLTPLFEASKVISKIASDRELVYDDWTAE